MERNALESCEKSKAIGNVFRILCRSKSSFAIDIEIGLFLPCTNISTPVKQTYPLTRFYTKSI